MPLPPIRPLEPWAGSNAQALDELRRCIASLNYFANNYWLVRDPRTGQMGHLETSGDWWPVALRLYTYQFCPYVVLANKSRGLGFTSEMRCVLYWDAALNAMTDGNASFNEDEANHFLDKIREVRAEWHRLGYHWLLPRLTTDNRSEMEFEHGGSITSHPCSDNTARGRDYFRFFADETPAWKDREAPAMHSIVGAVVKRGGKLIEGSTPVAGSGHESRVANAAILEGEALPVHEPHWPGKVDPITGEPAPFVRDTFHRDFAQRIGWTGTTHTRPWPVSPVNGMVLLSPHWSEYAFYTEADAAEWLRSLNGDIPKFCEEYELSSEAAQRSVFARADIEACAKVGKAVLTHPLNTWRAGHRYVIAVDQAEGLDHGDDTWLIACAIDASGRFVGVPHHFAGPLDEAATCHMAARWMEAIYAAGSHAMLVPEANRTGMMTLFQEIYPHLVPGVYRYIDPLQQAAKRGRARKAGRASRAPERLGIWMSEKVKKGLIAEQQEWLFRRMPLPDLPVLIRQLTRFQYVTTGSQNVRAEAPAGEKDDGVMAWLMAAHGMREYGVRLEDAPALTTAAHGAEGVANPDRDAPENDPDPYTRAQHDRHRAAPLAVAWGTESPMESTHGWLL